MLKGLCLPLSKAILKHFSANTRNFFQSCQFYDTNSNIGKSGDDGDDYEMKTDTRDVVGVSYSSLITQPFKNVDFADVLFISFATSLSKLTCQSRGNLIQRVLLNFAQFEPRELVTL